MMADEKKRQLTSNQWLVLLWLAGVLGLAVVAGVFKLLLYFAY